MCFISYMLKTAGNLAGELPPPVEPDLLQGPCLFQGLNPHQLDVIQGACQGHHALRLLVSQAQVHMALWEQNIRCYLQLELGFPNAREVLVGGIWIPWITG